VVDVGRAHAETFAQIRPERSFIGLSGFIDPLTEAEVKVVAPARDG
jgi:hypothetical protein